MRAALAELLDAVFPRTCRLCGVAAADGLACGAHLLPRAPDPPRCGRCAVPLGLGLADGHPCPACRRDPPPFDRVLALGGYGDPGVPGALRPWVLALKHGGRRDLAQPLGERLAARLAGATGDGSPAPGDWLVPVPAHFLRRLERGYDQARLLGEALARGTGLPLRRALHRRRATAVQGAPGSRSRRANVRGAFVLEPDLTRPLVGARVWLVDDVVTSGATAAECARVLRRGGARRVGVVCLARAGEALARGGRSRTLPPWRRS